MYWCNWILIIISFIQHSKSFEGSSYETDKQKIPITFYNPGNFTGSGETQGSPEDDDDDEDEFIVVD